MEWISVEDRLPDNDGICIAFPTQTGNSYPVRYFRTNEWLTLQGNTVWNKKPTHWMPLPEPPEVK